jgi:hypothetical protein
MPQRQDWHNAGRPLSPGDPEVEELGHPLGDFKLRMGPDAKVQYSMTELQEVTR